MIPLLLVHLWLAQVQVASPIDDESGNVTFQSATFNTGTAYVQIVNDGTGHLKAGDSEGNKADLPIQCDSLNPDSRYWTNCKIIKPEHVITSDLTWTCFGKCPPLGLIQEHVIEIRTRRETATGCDELGKKAGKRDDQCVMVALDRCPAAKPNQPRPDLPEGLFYDPIDRKCMRDLPECIEADNLTGQYEGRCQIRVTKTLYIDGQKIGPIRETEEK